MPEDFYNSEGFDKQDNRDWVKKNLDTVVRYFYWMVKYLQDHQFGKKAKLCPAYRIKYHHTVIDNRIFGGMLLSIGHIDNIPEFESNKLFHWSTFFDFERFEVNNPNTFKSFHLFLRTDGVSVSLCYDIEKVLKDATVPRDHVEFVEWYNDPSSNSDEFRTTGLDPGVVNVASTAEVQPNGEFPTSEYSLGRHRNDSGILRSQRELTRRVQTVEPLLTYRDVSSRASLKTVDLEQLMLRRDLMHNEHDDNGHSLYDRLFVEKSLRYYRNRGFRVFRGTRKAIAAYVSSLHEKGEAPLIILYGAGRWGHRKGNAAAPNKKFREECERQYIVVIVDEWMTSQTCPVCCSRLPKTIKQLEVPAADGRTFDNVRGLLFCETCSSHAYWNRDMVGALNILHVGTTLPDDLPDILRRECMNSRPDRGPAHKLKV